MLQTDIQIPSERKLEIVQRYEELLNQHIEELKAGSAEHTMGIQDIAAMMYIHPRHLRNTIHEVTGKSPCNMYEQKLMDITRELILATNSSIASIARHLMYDPSNFSKFFKYYEGVTPKEFRESANSKN